MPFLFIVPRPRLMGLLPGLLTLAGCSEGPPPTIVPPAVPVSDLVRSESVAIEIERILLDDLTRALAQGFPGKARPYLVEEGFRGVGFTEGQRTTAGPLEVQWLLGAKEEAASPAAFLESLAALARLSRPERV